MSDDLLVHYNRELLNIRRAAADFAEKHPRIAGRLRMSADAVEDPHVERLIEGFAYLTARIRQKLDDDFPELVEALLGILYPHYLRPIPAMAVLRMDGAPELAGVHRVPAGVMIDSEPVDGETCRFRTVYPVELHPLRLTGATLASRPFPAPAVPQASGAAACLRLSFASTMPGVSFGAIKPGRLRFFLRGQPSLVYPLHELLLNDAVAVAFATSPNEPALAVSDGSAFSQVGLEADEGLLDYPANAHSGFRLLTEFFVFPEKFLFVDLAFPDALPVSGETLDVFVYLKRSMPQIERAVSTDAFALGCTPIVNLFPQAAEPIRLSHQTSDYRVVPDSRRQAGLEVYSIERVTLTGADDKRRDVFPFYSLRHSDASVGMTEDHSGEAWWLANRRMATGYGGTESFISLVDPDFNPQQLPDEILSVDTLCMNRDLPGRLPFGGGHPLMQLVKPSPLITQMRCLTAPTPVLRSMFGKAGRWRLISHLSLNYLSLIDTNDAHAIREILALYDIKDSAETRALIDSVVAVSAKLGSARVRGMDQIAFCRGVDIDLTFDESHFSGSNVFLMATVLERFFGLYASVNAFSRLTARVKGRTGVLRTWPARAGERVLL